MNTEQSPKTDTLLALEKATSSFSDRDFLKIRAASIEAGLIPDPEGYNSQNVNDTCIEQGYELIEALAEKLEQVETCSSPKRAIAQFSIHHLSANATKPDLIRQKEAMAVDGEFTRDDLNS